MAAGRMQLAAALALAGVTVGGGVALTGRAHPSSAPATAAPEADPIAAGAARARADMAAHFWDAAGSPASDGLPRIRATEGDGGPRNGLVVDGSRAITFWQMAQYANLLHATWKQTADPDAAAKLAAEWRSVKAAYLPALLAGDGAADHSVNVSDDAAWKANYLAQAHEVTGDPAALDALAEMIPATLARFRAPGPQRAFGASPRGAALAAGSYGITYAAPRDGPALRTYGLISSLYEAMLANAALYAFEKTGDGAYRDYAVHTWAWIRANLRTAKENDADTATGVYLCDLELGPAVADRPAARHRFWGKPIRGLSAEYSGGTLAMAVLSARLYRLTHDDRYLAEARGIVAAFTLPDAFGRTRGRETLLVNERDPWTDGYWYPSTVAEVLTLPGVDADGRFRAALRATARAIVAARTPAGYYPADWSGPELTFTDGTRTWAERGRRANGGRGGGQATPEQVMTSAGGAAVVQAAAGLGRADPHG